MALLNSNGHYFKVESVNTETGFIVVKEYESLQHRNNENEFHQALKRIEKVDLKLDDDMVADIQAKTLKKYLKKMAYISLKEQMRYSQMTDA